MGFPGGRVVKNPPANAGDTRDAGLIPGSGRASTGGNGNPLQYSCLKNSRDRGSWWASTHRVAKSRSQLSMHAHAMLNVKIHILWQDDSFLHTKLLTAHSDPPN